MCSLVGKQPSRGSMGGALSMGEMLWNKYIVGSCDQLHTMGCGSHKFARAHSEREGGFDIYCIYKLCEHDINITEPLSPRWHG